MAIQLSSCTYSSTTTLNGSRGPEGGPSVEDGIGYDFGDKVRAGLALVITSRADFGLWLSPGFAFLWHVSREFCEVDLF